MWPISSVMSSVSHWLSLQGQRGSAKLSSYWEVKSSFRTLSASYIIIGNKKEFVVRTWPTFLLMRQAQWNAAPFLWIVFAFWETELSDTQGGNSHSPGRSEHASGFLQHKSILERCTALFNIHEKTVRAQINKTKSQRRQRALPSRRSLMKYDTCSVVILETLDQVTLRNRDGWLF